MNSTEVPSSEVASRASRLRSIGLRLVPMALTGYTAAIFLDSLRYKFTNQPQTQVIFGRLNEWTASLGADGLFARTGLFSQYVIGSAELVATTLLVLGLTKRFAPLGVIGSALGLAIMTGAISFHLFTPLGVDPNNNGGGLFVAAVGVWIGNAALLFLRRKKILPLLSRLRAAIDLNAPQTKGA